MAVLSSKSFVIENDKTRKGKGPLIKVEIGPGQYRKMYQVDAVKAGLIAAPVHHGGHGAHGDGGEGAGEKRREGEGNKMRPVEGNKVKQAGGEKGVSMETGAPSPLAPLPERRGGEDDFTSIPGVGRATAKLLKMRGVGTLDQLRAASKAKALGDLGLSGAAQAAIAAWFALEEPEA